MSEIVREKITTPDAWLGPEMQGKDSWVWQLTSEDIAEIDAALDHAKSQNLSIPFVREMFPLPSVSTRLGELTAEVTKGEGVVLVRGLPIEQYSKADCELLYWGIGVHIGNPVSQNGRGHVLGHVTDEGKDLSDPNARGYQTRNRLDFHCDQLPVDMIGLFCLRTAKSGGASYLVSAPTVHNTVREERPDLLDVLYDMLHVDWRGDHPDGGQPWYDMPMFSAIDGKIASRFCNRSFLESVSRYGEELSLTDKHREALDLVQEIANRPELRLSMDFQKGDMQFINNHTVMHARGEYEDFDEPDRKRHLLRMWIGLADEIRRPLSPRLNERYRLVETGGIPKQAAA